MQHAKIEKLLQAYSLNILTGNEQEIVKRHLGSGCDSCCARLAEYESVVGLLGLDCEPEAPPAELKADLMQAISKSSPPKIEQADVVRRAADGEWRELFPGISTKELFRDPETDYRTALVQMAAGSSLPKHLHHGDEETFVVQGSCTNNGEYFSQGDYWHVPSGFVHEATDTEAGCLLLVRFLEVEFEKLN